MSLKKHIVLFMDMGGNNLCQMAESVAKNIKGNSITILSASMLPPVVNPIAEDIMRESAFEFNSAMLTLLDIEPYMVDLIITLGDFDQSCRPTLIGMPPHFHWDMPDPSRDMPDNEKRLALIEALTIIKEKINTLFASELLNALFVMRKNFELILDNLMDGVMAHTTNRRIFYFNKAAETITGYDRNQLLGKDCHDVFPQRFCGGECLFCEGKPNVKTPRIKQREVLFGRQDEKQLILKMFILPLTNQNGKEVGALISFKDDTELHLLKQRVKHHHALGRLFGKDPKMIRLFDYIREVSSVNVPVLIQGESGTGKELVANAIHDNSSRAEKSFVAINCGALPEDILESELFGHVRGAFTGAHQDRKGRFELADGGTIFLDEVGELSPSMQVKLLRVLQEQKFERVGGEKSIKVDVRVISATNQNLRQLMEKKKFRRDLFYRLCVIPITLPPLRERKLDIPMLVEHFTDITAKEIKRPILTPTNEALDFLTKYNWPGNVRELRNAIEYAYVKCRSGMIEPIHLPPEITNSEEKSVAKPGPILKKKEEVIVAIEKAMGNRKQAAKILGVGRATLYRYLDHYALK